MIFTSARYVVLASQWAVTSCMGLGIKVQSVKAPWHVEERVDAFLAQFRDVIVQMPAEEFEKKKAGLAARLLERPKNLYEEGNRFLADISSGYCDFLRGASLARSLVRSFASDMLLLDFQTRWTPLQLAR